MNICDNTEQLNRLYVCRKSQAFLNQVPIGTESPHINTSQLWSQRRSHVHQNWRDYISPQQERLESKTEISIWTNRNISSVSLRKWLQFNLKNKFLYCYVLKHHLTYWFFCLVQGCSLLEDVLYSSQVFSTNDLSVMSVAWKSQIFFEKHSHFFAGETENDTEAYSLYLNVFLSFQQELSNALLSRKWWFTWNKSKCINFVKVLNLST